MPRGDRTGPAGFGPMTGRALGYCAGYSVPGYANPIGGRFGMGRGYGFGWGRGFGFRHRYYATGLPYWAGFGTSWTYPPVYPPVAYPYGYELSTDDEIQILKEQTESLKKALKDAENRMKSLKSKLEKKKE
jgi:hypothetical protein